MEQKILFYEKQQFRQLWLWTLLAVVFAVVLFSIIKISNTGENNILLILVVFIPLFLVAFFLWKLTLITKVDETGIHVKFAYFHRNFKHYKWNNIRSLEIKKYNPIGDYGGWGIRMGAYNVSGDDGLLVRFKDGTTLLIGTNRPEELKQALQNTGKLN